jgi:hypothetical protein
MSSKAGGGVDEAEHDGAEPSEVRERDDENEMT